MVYPPPSGNNAQPGQGYPPAASAPPAYPPAAGQPGGAPPSYPPSQPGAGAGAPPHAYPQKPPAQAPGYPPPAQAPGYPPPAQAPGYPPPAQAPGYPPPAQAPGYPPPAQAPGYPPPAAAAVAPPPSYGSSMDGISDADLAAYQRLSGEIMQLMQRNVENACKDFETRAVAAKQNMEQAALTSKNLEVRMRKEGKDVEKMKGGGHKFFHRLKGDLDKKVAKEQREYEEAQKAYEHSQQELLKAEQYNAHVNQEAAQLKAQVARLHQLRGEEVKLVDRIFRGPGGDARENQLEGEAAGLEPRMRQVREAKQKWDAGRALLATAQTQLSQAVSSLQQANQLATADVMMSGPRIGYGYGYGRGYGYGYGGGMNTMVDVMKHGHVGEARNFVNSAKSNIIQARQCIPNIPAIQEAQVNTMNAAFDIFFDNIITDLQVKQQIQNSMQSVQVMQAQTTQGLAWVDGVLANTINKDLAAADGAYFQKKAELDQYRHQLIQNALRQRGSRLASSAPPPYGM